MIFERGPMTTEELMSSGLSKPLSSVTKVINGMLFDNQLRSAGDKFDISADDRPRYAMLLGLVSEEEPREIVQSAKPAPFHVIRASNIPTSAGRRPGTEARDIHFLALSSNVPVHWVEQS